VTGPRTEIAGRKIRVLVVDDSVVIRHLVTGALQGEAGIEAVGSASNGVVALQRIQQLKPDAITLDIEMPEMDGLATVREVRKRYPGVRIVMFSTLTRRGASATIDALALGADDYVTKPSNNGSLDVSLEVLRRELVPKLRQFFSVAAGQPAPVSPLAQLHATRPRPEVLVIGVSTGGPVALARVIPGLPRDFPAPVLITQHMPPVFTKMLAARLQSASAIRVVEAAEGEILERGKAIVAPGDFHMHVRRRDGAAVIHLDQGPAENSCRPAVDVMFRSVCEVYGGAAAAVILTGMGQDGLKGTEMLRSKGAYVIAQDEATSVVWGMPRAVVQAGLADSVVPLDGVAAQIRKQFNC